MTRNKHPADRAERRRLNETKSGERKRVKGLPAGSPGTVSPESETE